MNLKSKYLNLELDNPIIVGASNLSADLKVLESLQEAGAGAIVYKSLFEEQIQIENLQTWEEMKEYNDRNAEMTTIFPDESRYEHGPEEFIYEFKKARKLLKIPLIASLNCVYDDTWYEYAKRLEKAGADALELNFYSVPKDFEMDGSAIFKEQVDTLTGVKNAIKIPVSVKLSPFYTNPLYAIKELEKAGADGFALFNRLYQPDIDIEKEKLDLKYQSSEASEHCLPLRYAGLLYGNTKASIACGSGIHTSEDIIRMLLAGADATHIVTTIYKHGPDIISKMKDEISEWMKRKGYMKIDDFKGKLSKKNITNDPFAYRRAQYVDAIMNIKRFFKDPQR
ncbi:MAG: dihydroorotate dehydrogenase-like protein [Hyphomicrobiales bacterium]